MESVATRLAAQLRTGDLILLSGALGAGKTFFVSALAPALGVQEQVTSPTFVMMRNYRGRFPINHIDAYRLLDAPNPRKSLDELDFEIDDAVTIIEWGAGFDLTGMALSIDIEIGEGESRTLVIEGADSRWSELKL